MIKALIAFELMVFILIVVMAVFLYLIMIPVVGKIIDFIKEYLNQ